MGLGIWDSRYLRSAAAPLWEAAQSTGIHLLPVSGLPACDAAFRYVTRPANMTTPTEGYVWTTYGPEKYLRQAVASVGTLRRYDRQRPTALYCPKIHHEILSENGVSHLFDEIALLTEKHRSIVGVKHHLHAFMPFDRTIWLDADMVWCRNPDPLWQRLATFPFTITGLERADAWFGGPKGLGIIPEYFLDRRRRTLNTFDLDHLPRVQSGLMFGRDRTVVQEVCETASDYLERQEETHFRSRLQEKGRNLESCEWSLAMAMSALELQVYPWFFGYESPQLDFIEELTEYDDDFHEVRCRYYCDRFLYSLRGLPSKALQRWLIRLARQLPGRGDYMEVTPYLLHFGWIHEKEPFETFARRTWRRIVNENADVSADTTYE